MNKRFSIFTGVVAATLVLAACGGSSENKSGSPDGSFDTTIALADDFDPGATFTFAFLYPSQTLDPVNSGSGNDATYMNPIYDRLIQLTPTGEYEPMLAKSWDASAEANTLTLKLRENLKFTDGTVFDAAAVKTNLDRSRLPESRLANEVATVTGVKVIDDLTVQINVSSGLGAIVGSLAGRPGMMASPKAIASGKLDTAPVGIGPYVATKIIPGAEVSYEKTDNYWEPDAQRVKAMVIRAMPDDQTRLNALTAGEASAITLSADQVKTAQNADFNVLSVPGYSYDFLAINTKVEPFDNPDVRMALAQLIDRKAIGDGLYSGFCTPQIQPWPVGSVAYDKKLGAGLDAWPHDVEQAKALLAKAGYADGFSFSMVVSNLTSSVKEAEAIQSQFKEANIKVEIKPQPAGGIGEHFFIQKSDPAANASYTGSPDPAAVMDRNYFPAAQYNPGGDMPKAMEDLAVEGASAIDPAARADAYSKIMELMVKDPGNIIPICIRHNTLGFEKGISNVAVSQGSAVDLRGVAVAKK